jgi:hypothetical protein
MGNRIHDLEGTQARHLLMVVNARPNVEASSEPHSPGVSSDGDEVTSQLAPVSKPRSRRRNTVDVEQVPLLPPEESASSEDQVVETSGQPDGKSSRRRSKPVRI